MHWLQPWLFLVWDVDIIEKILSKSSSGHELILVAIDYFTKWVDAASYTRLASSGVTSFIRSHIICRLESLMSWFRKEEYSSVQMLTLYYKDTGFNIIDRLHIGRKVTNCRGYE